MELSARWLVVGHALLAALDTDGMQGYAHAAVRKGRVPAVYMLSLVVLSLALKFCFVQPEPRPLFRCAQMAKRSGQCSMCVHTF